MYFPAGRVEINFGLPMYRAVAKEVCNGGVAYSLLKMAADKPRPLLQNSLLPNYITYLCKVQIF